MGGDYPDYCKKVVVVYEGTITGGEVLVDHRKILGIALKTPTFPYCIPTSIENAAIAYDAVTDRFKVDVQAMTIGTIDVNVTDRADRLLGHITVDNFPATYDVSDRWARSLGQVDLARVLGSALAHANPVIARLTDGSAFIDPRDVSDRAARLLGIIYGDKGQLAQRTTSKDLYVQLRTAGSEIDPTQIRALTSSDAITIYGSQTQKLLQRASTYDAIVQLRHNGVEINPTQIRALTNADVVTVEQSNAASLKATVTQASIARTVTGTVTAEQATRTSLKTQPEREDLISLGGTQSPNNAGVEIIAPDGQKKIKVYDCGYCGGVDGTHCFYFGTTTALTTKRLASLNKLGVVHQTYVQPRVSAAADGLYIYASVNESGGMIYDVGYVQE